MNEHDATDLLSRLVADAPVGPAPTTELLRCGRSSRRRALAAGLTAAGVAVIIVVVGLAGRGQQPDRPSGTADTTPASESVVAYVVEEGELVPRQGTIVTTGDPGVDALRHLFGLRPDEPDSYNGFNFGTVEPEPLTDVRSVTHSSGRVTVDLTADMWDPFPAVDFSMLPDGELATQQLVRTIQTALGTDDPVVVTVDGEPARGIWLHPLRGPVPAEEVAPQEGTVTFLEVPARPDDPVYRQWAQRSQLPSCGVVERGPAVGGAATGQGWACLADARDSGRTAELALSEYTIEGDPVRSWYRVTGSARLEVFRDATEDMFGERTWTYTECPAPVVLRNGCAG